MSICDCDIGVWCRICLARRAVQALERRVKDWDPLDVTGPEEEEEAAEEYELLCTRLGVARVALAALERERRKEIETWLSEHTAVEEV